MIAKSSLTCAFICLLFSFCAAARVKRPLLIGRTSSSIRLPDGKTIRVFGFAGKLGKQPGLPGTTIEAEVGDSLVIDLWNVSQGDPHDIKIHGIELQKENERLAVDADKAIRHMEHGYYSFVANHAGTYIYYCPVNEPFNIQAGMFGMLIIKPKHDNNTPVLKEQLWCGYEIDTNWHTDAVMDVERGEKPLLEEKLPYHPQYFLVNSKAAMLNAKQGESVLIRMANAGFMEHVVTFPDKLAIHVLTKNAKPYTVNLYSNTIRLKPLETCEVLVTCDAVYNGYVNYAFENENGSIVQVKKTPVSITKK